ncbi:MAG TPA: DUF2911 domain-containing protein [Patescibacteria group bacterium]|nr:DUF2911 domain-containing protein [Patescibacteria group bacterium]
MKKIALSIATVALLGLSSVSINAQQLRVPAPSPLATLDQSFALSNIKIEYSRPSARGRVVFGDVVPFGKVWRTGANASTKITFGEDVTVEGKSLKAGTYALYTIPNRDSWDVMFYRDLNLGGNVADYKAENEVARINVRPSTLANKVETFTINVANVNTNSAQVEMNWENTRVAFNVTADIDSKIMRSIETALAADTRPYYQAASYYYDNNKDMNQALSWVTKAVDQNPKAFWVAHLKAKIQMRLKDYKGAIQSAEQSMALAREAKNDDYVKMNEKLISDAKAGR